MVIIIEIIVEYANFENTIRELQGNGQTCITLGKKSYIVTGKLEIGQEGHILVGNYCSIANDIVFNIGLNHDYRGLITYPELLIGETENNDAVTANKIVRPYNLQKSQIIIGSDVWIGRGVTIMGGVKIGNGAVIGASAVVAKDVPPYAIVIGNPGRVVKYRFTEVIREKLNQIKWWYWDEAKIIEQKDSLMNVEAFVGEHYDGESLQRCNNSVVRQLQQLRQDGYKLFYFIPDFTAKRSVWEKVLQQYLDKYTSKDKTVLIVEMNNAKAYKAETEKIYAMIRQFGEASAAIMSNQAQSELPINVLQNIDYFITTRDYTSLQCYDYGYDYGVKFLCGLDVWVFDVV